MSRCAAPYYSGGRIWQGASVNRRSVRRGRDARFVLSKEEWFSEFVDASFAADLLHPRRQKKRRDAQEAWWTDRLDS